MSSLDIYTSNRCCPGSLVMNVLMKPVVEMFEAFNAYVKPFLNIKISRYCIMRTSIIDVLEVTIALF